jgi:hypothetical protein
MDWQDLFARGADYETSVAAVRDALARHRGADD